MRKQKGRREKDPWAGLPEEWRDEIQQSSVDDINTKIAELAKAEAENLQAKADDPDLKEKKEEVKQCSEVYREASKGYKLRMKFIMSVLEGRGKA